MYTPYKTELYCIASNKGLAPIVSADLHATVAAAILSSTHQRLAILVNVIPLLVTY